MPFANLKPGQIESDGKTYLAIGTADGAISVTDLQIAGKKRMGVQDFLLGYRDIDKAEIIAETLRQDPESRS